MRTRGGSVFVDASDDLAALFSNPNAVIVAKKRPAQRRESDIQEAILDYLNRTPGCVAWKSGAASFRASYRDRKTGAIRERFVKVGRAGVSDIIGWVRTTVRIPNGPNGAPFVFTYPRWLAIEVKRPGEKPKPHQQRFLDRVHDSGGLALVARSVDDVRRGLGL